MNECRRVVLRVLSPYGIGHDGAAEIAERLCISTKTVNAYRDHIKDKLDLVDANELLRTAITWVNAER